MKWKMKNAKRKTERDAVSDWPHPPAPFPTGEGGIVVGNMTNTASGWQFGRRLAVSSPKSIPQRGIMFVNKQAKDDKFPPFDAVSWGDNV